MKNANIVWTAWKGSDRRERRSERTKETIRRKRKCGESYNSIRVTESLNYENVSRMAYVVFQYELFAIKITLNSRIIRCSSNEAERAKQMRSFSGSHCDSRLTHIAQHFSAILSTFSSTLSSLAIFLAFVHRSLSVSSGPPHNQHSRHIPFQPI